MNQAFDLPINNVLLFLQTCHLLSKGTRIIQCPQRLRAGFNDFLFLLDHLVDRFQKSILQFLLPKMGRRTRGPLRLVLPVTAPYPRTIGICTVPDIAAVIRAAFPAHNSVGKYAGCTGMSALLLATPQFVLDKVKYFLRDNRRMAVLDIVLRNFSLIRLLFLLKEIYCERLLQQGISFVLFICQNGLHRAALPLFLACGRGDSLSRQTGGNAGGRLPVQKHAIDLTNDFCLILHDLHRSILALFIPKKM